MARRKGGRKVPHRHEHGYMWLTQDEHKHKKEFEAFKNQPATIEAVAKLVMRLEVEIKQRLNEIEKRLNEIEGEKRIFGGYKKR